MSSPTRLRPLPQIDPELLSRLDIAGPRYTSYPPVPTWHTGFDQLAYREALQEAGQQRRDEPLSLYVHIPFCQTLCHYCGCNVVITSDRDRVDRYLAAVVAEAGLVAAELGARRRLSRLHLGGGTPTFLDEEQLSVLWQGITRHFSFTDDAELALEVNPTGTRASQLALLAEMGFRRLSIGVQDFDPKVQAAVGRTQSVAETEALINAARGCGFSSINLDLIYGLPRQTEASFQATLAEVVRLMPERIATFSFAYLPELKPNQRRLPAIDLPTPMQKLALHEVAITKLTENGYLPIGMDHFARPEDELAQAAMRGELSRDFQGYTVSRAPDTVALGITGISSTGRIYAQNVKALGQYQTLVGEGRLPIERGLRLTDDDIERREIINQLMCNFYVDLNAAGTRYDSELAALKPLIADGLVKVEGRRIAATSLGCRFVRNIAMVFDAHIPTPSRRSFSRVI